MNLYFVVEGATCEPAVYKKWVPLINADLKYVTQPQLVATDNFCIVSGGGYPNYLDIIRDSAEDYIALGGFDRLVICIDSEDLTYEEKLTEVEKILIPYRDNIDYRIVVQHNCFESWALGNRSIGPRNPSNERLRLYRKEYDVAKLDPAELPSLDPGRFNRSQFAELYLRLLLNDRNRGITYSKNNPSHIAHPKYFAQLKNRLFDTGHISSFNTLLTACS